MKKIDEEAVKWAARGAGVGVVGRQVFAREALGTPPSHVVPSRVGPAASEALPGEIYCCNKGVGEGFYEGYLISCACSATGRLQ